MVKAFCPQENVKVIVEGDPHAQKALREDSHIFMDIRFEEELLTVVIHGARNRGPQERAEGAGCSAGPGPAAAQTESDFETADAASASLDACVAVGLEEADAAADYVRSASVQDGTVKSRDLKDVMKSLLYDTLSSYTGLELPWGDLIGIRPTKIAMAQIEDGSTDAEAAAYLMREHRVSRQKALLAVDIANREKRILSDIHYENGYSLYIGIPFCPTTCLYCSFPSFNIGSWRNRLDEYVDALVRELWETARLME